MKLSSTLELVPEKSAKRAKPSCLVRVTGMRSTIPNQKDDDVLVVNCTSRSKVALWKELSPFFLGPIDLYGKEGQSETFENAWQYAKVYEEFATKETADSRTGIPEPTSEYFHWARTGWAKEKAVRFPMGKGAVPLYSLWDYKKYDYINARKKIYAPLYATAVMQTDAYAELERLRDSGDYKEIWLRDYDGYDSVSKGASFKHVLNNPKKKMGHGFVLAMCLMGEKVWEDEDESPQEYDN